MELTREELEGKYLLFGDLLQSRYKNFTFKNHCYWRIANDYACKAKWDTVVEKPFYKNASDEQLNNSVIMLRDMFYDSKVIIEFNKQSLKYRKNVTA